MKQPKCIIDEIVVFKNEYNDDIIQQGKIFSARFYENEWEYEILEQWIELPENKPSIIHNFTHTKTEKEILKKLK